MKRLSFAVTISLVLLLLPGAVWAHHGFHRGVHSGHMGFVHHGHHRFFHPHHHFFIPPHRFGPTFLVVEPAPHWVWVRGFWHWNGFQWVWVPGHWVR